MGRFFQKSSRLSNFHVLTINAMLKKSSAVVDWKKIDQVFEQWFFVLSTFEPKLDRLATYFFPLKTLTIFLASIYP